jgi:hypothetical protein
MPHRDKHMICRRENRQRARCLAQRFFAALRAISWKSSSVTTSGNVRTPFSADVCGRQRDVAKGEHAAASANRSTGAAGLGRDLRPESIAAAGPE